jgi:integrase
MSEHRLERPVINGRPSAVWYIVWTEGRRSRRFSTKTTDKVEARKVLARFAAVEDAPPETFTVGDLCDAYLKTREEDPGVAYPKAIRNSLNHVKAAMGALPPSMISRATIRSYTSQRRRAGVMDSTISKELRFLRQALKFGVNEKWMTHEPKVEIPGESVARERFLTREEFARLYFHASPFHLRLFLALSICTGARGKHILALTWDRIDFVGEFVRYRPANPNSKKRTAPIPMSPPLLHMLEIAHKARGKSGRVVEWRGKPVKSVRKAYERACALAGLEDAHRHDLRRTAASWAVQDGVSFEEVATMLGDSVEITRKHYAIFSATYLRGAVNAIAGPSR